MQQTECQRLHGSQVQTVHVCQWYKAGPAWVCTSIKLLRFSVCRNTETQNHDTMTIWHHVTHTNLNTATATATTTTAKTILRSHGLSPGLPGWAGTRKIKPVWTDCSMISGLPSVLWHWCCKMLVWLFCLGWGADLHMAQLMHCHSLSLAPVNPDWFYLRGTSSPG